MKLSDFRTNSQTFT